ncbi:hypothetical protein M8J76_015535 [Diaphorina citri]|nr:hypothetical protein M8J76_015535 [Diaphorina citri]
MASSNSGYSGDYEHYDSTEEDMTYDEKRDLVMDLVINFIRIVETREPKAIVRTEDDGVQTDFDKLHASTLRAVDLKLKEYHAALEEKTPKFRGLNKLTGEPLQLKIEELECQIAKIDDYLDYKSERQMSKEYRKMRGILDKGKLDGESSQRIKDLFEKYSLDPAGEMPNVSDSSSDESSWSSSEDTDMSGWTSDSAESLKSGASKDSNKDLSNYSNKASADHEQVKML